MSKVLTLANNYKKNDVKKLLKNAGFIENGNESWCVPIGTGQPYYDRVFSLGSKYLYYAYGYEVRTLSGSSWIAYERSEEARIAYKFVPADVLQDLINRILKMYKEASIELKKRNADKDFE